MANTKEIQDRIKSIQDTMKITRAMYMMSSMKLRKAKQKLEDTKPFFDGVQHGIAEAISHFPDMQHIYFDNRVKDRAETVKKKGYIIMTGDKGMAGAYNHNAIKEAVSLIGDPKDENYIALVVGEVGRAYFVGQGYRVEEKFRYSANNPTMHRARVITEFVLDLYNRELIDELYIVYTSMLNSITEQTCVERILPLKTRAYLRKEYHDERLGGAGNQINSLSADGQKADAGSQSAAGLQEDQAHHVRKLNSYELEAMEQGDSWIEFYPSPKAVLNKLVSNLTTGFVYGALVECSASEENARMMAMQSATDNAEAILHDLSIEYNRVRQARITQEITEVIGGAKALKKKKLKKKQQAR